MNAIEKKVLERLSHLIRTRFPDAQLILFGSRARGDADPESDMDVLVLIEADDMPEARRFISDCAWEAGFDNDLIVVPVVYRKSDWEYGPERYSLLAKAVQRDGIAL
ncbi:MAG TPA: nucleotidyltransferase domain-containing protein [Thermodesulfobacteriota bacterium]|nr:nucleotidyltransferase domain-containing protein [Deltaproteobacteria bacterium]HNR12800.1 nucleotidyltransferase domain-containing protein [Thermodesulfobacteriota bacterium]HNU70352.1 nucleotidyltransferase domain-containing protein [Thermodesulfobacteriota bacterium]